MTNIYFPDEEITFNDLYYICFIIERTARRLKQHNRYIVNLLGTDGLAHQLSIAQTSHCLNPDQVVDDWINEYRMEKGEHDVTAIDHRFTDNIPSDTQMGKVYARLISNLNKNDNLTHWILEVYNSPICDILDNYNSSAYYEPQYVQTQAFLKGEF